MMLEKEEYGCSKGRKLSLNSEDEMEAGHSKEEQARLKAAIRKLSKVELSYMIKFT